MGPTQPPVFLEQGLFLWDKSGRGLKLTANLHPFGVKELVGLYLRSPTRLRSVGK
jgi:hypothetical protein